MEDTPMQQHRTIVVADHHKSVFVCQVLDRETGEVRKQTLESSRRALEPFLRGLPGPVHVFVEACRAWEWVSDLCADLSIAFDLVDPSRMPEIAQSTKKSDERDVEAMVQRLLVTGELPLSYRASREQRELRGLTRRLSSLRHDKRKLLHRIHALIDSHGLPATKASFPRSEWREELKAKLSPDAWLVLESLLSQYDLVLGWMEVLEQRVEELLQEREDYRRLQAVPGIGPVIAATILAETAGIERFGSARKFAAFTGLVPRVRSSGGRGKDKTKIGRITRCGPPDLRWALGQAAMVGLRARQQTAISGMYRRKKKKGKHGRLAICASAHKLARVVYVLLSRQDDFQASPTRRKKVA
jgi:transposase